MQLADPRALRLVAPSGDHCATLLRHRRRIYHDHTLLPSRSVPSRPVTEAHSGISACQACRWRYKLYALDAPLALRPASLCSVRCSLSHLKKGTDTTRQPIADSSRSRRRVCPSASSVLVVRCDGPSNSSAMRAPPTIARSLERCYGFDD